VSDLQHYFAVPDHWSSSRTPRDIKERQISSANRQITYRAPISPDKCQCPGISPAGALHAVWNEGIDNEERSSPHPIRVPDPLCRPFSARLRVQLRLTRVIAV